MLLKAQEQDANTVHPHGSGRGQNTPLHMAIVRRVETGWLVVAGSCVEWADLEPLSATRDEAIAHVQREAHDRHGRPRFDRAAARMITFSSCCTAARAICAVRRTLDPEKIHG